MRSLVECLPHRISRPTSGDLLLDHLCQHTLHTLDGTFYRKVDGLFGRLDTSWLDLSLTSHTIFPYRVYLKQS
jgi:hypothetical protein